MVNGTELPACPFCGGKPSPISVEGHQECTNPKCCIMGQVFSLDEWRTRAEPAPCAKSQGGAPAPHAVGRYLEPGPRYRGAERVPQIRSYAEFSAESVKNSDGVWLEGEQVYTRPAAPDVVCYRYQHDGAPGQWFYTRDSRCYNAEPVTLAQLLAVLPKDGRLEPKPVLAAAVSDFNSMTTLTIPEWLTSSCTHTFRDFVTEGGCPKCALMRQEAP